MGRKKLPQITRQQYNDLKKALEASNNLITNVGVNTEDLKDQLQAERNSFRIRLVSFQQDINNLQQEKSNLLEVIQALGQQLGENRSDINNLELNKQEQKIVNEPINEQNYQEITKF
jgi:uncharacterized protein YjbK